MLGPDVQSATSVPRGRHLAVCSFTSGIRIGRRIASTSPQWFLVRTYGSRHSTLSQFDVHSTLCCALWIAWAAPWGSYTSLWMGSIRCYKITLPPPMCSCMFVFIWCIFPCFVM
ncbi:hypothetical protein O6H91_Y107600 [Diphasiastrum complanatum]|nr:hypothetical protein O6H91_Y107600 [Diphasiastrum complanatum]